MNDQDPNLTQLLSDWRAGHEAARDSLMAHVYTRLRAMAAAQVRHSGAAWQPTELANELYLELVEAEPVWFDRRHFFRAAAVAMRNILIDLAREQGSLKRGGDAIVVTMSALDHVAAPQSFTVLALNESLSALRAADQRKADILELVHLVGLTIEEAAETLGLSVATANRDLRFARAWMRAKLKG